MVPDFPDWMGLVCGQVILYSSTNLLVFQWLPSRVMIKCFEFTPVQVLLDLNEVGIRRSFGLIVRHYLARKRPYLVVETM